ncbi:MAG: DUF4202 domain-containing protein [Rugosibacter sp.]
MSEQPANQECFARAMALFDAANREDPNQDDGQPKELRYSQRMSEMLGRYAPDADEAVQLAVRAQHIRRWTVPRNSYPLNNEGYHQWRTGLYRLHADTAGELMRQAGYDEGMIARVKLAVAKRGLKRNPDAQLLEDVASLVFIEHYMLGFAASKPDYDEEKWLDIIRKTWRKMSAAAQRFALSGAVRLPEPLLPLIAKAVSLEQAS